ncbi:response regulator [Salipaludibacillus aurantiacus]|uniref:DNA-binding response regulator, NarL/FixJ family, contains REC and HTH domains n=1 Tax=Salipaludibacillus aurantiacus TaxID=1601833 RepID=A0A1H9UEJ3_9BACI|nr:response regulator transcription factor [Salipaludibacillus aurantiacus]SES07678.1 DNA-binding response regulator, NarL/FixJ family, contains REC and HTH domains [Salipaludibacillus aurantiacus]
MHNIILADDHQIVRDGLKMIVEAAQDLTVVEEASDGDELLDKAIELKPDLILSDLKMPGQSIIESSPRIITASPHTKIIVLTAYDNSEDIYNAMDAGVDGYIMKDTPPDKIMATIQMVIEGFSCFQPKVSRQHPGTAKESEKDKLQLTPREEEVFRCIVNNLSNHEISQELFISETTVKTHVSSILRKTGQPNRSQAVVYALKNRLIDIPV